MSFKHLTAGAVFAFAALPGATADGRRFIADAVARGAVAVLAPEGTAWPPGVPPRPMLCTPSPREKLAQFAVELAGSASQYLPMITSMAWQPRIASGMSRGQSDPGLMAA